MGRDPRHGRRRRPRELPAGAGIRADVAVARAWSAAPGTARPPGVADDPVLRRSRWRQVTGSRGIPYLRWVRSPMSRRQDIEAVHAAALTERAAGRIDSGEPQHQLRDRLE